MYFIVCLCVCLSVAVAVIMFRRRLTVLTVLVACFSANGAS
jgi:hypothetical protein